MNKTDYIIIGGGIIGMMTARELALQGAKVAIFERGELGKEASWAAGGILSPMRPWAEHPCSARLSQEGQLLYPKYLESLKEETGVDSEYMQSGLVIINEDHAFKTKSWAKNHDVKIEECGNNLLNVNIPNHAILLPEISQVNPSSLLKALNESLKKLSVSIYEHTEINDIVVKNKEFNCVNFNGKNVFAEALIITAGSWSKPILADIGVEINIKPIRGQMLYVKPNKKITDKMVLDDAHYFIPRQNGHVLIGSSMEDVGFVNQTTELAKQELLAWAYSVSHELGQSQLVNHWSGLRPSTDLGKPIIGASSHVKNIYLNTGHFRKGILQAPASAKLLTDHLSGKPSFMDINKLTYK